MMHNGLFTLGARIIETPYATNVRTKYHIERWPITKKRRGWHIRMEKITEPAAFEIDGNFYVHPSLMGKLREAAHTKMIDIATDIFINGTGAARKDARAIPGILQSINIKNLSPA